MTVQTPTPFPSSDPLPEQVVFDRHELGAILRLYGQMVAAGEWRDYGLSFLREAAVFSVFRRTAEMPLSPALQDQRMVWIYEPITSRVER